MRTNHRWAAIGAGLMFLAVAFGAFGAHLLKARIPADRLEIFQTGVTYQGMHALAILLVTCLAPRLSTRTAGFASTLFLGGVVIFSGSLYALALSGQRWLGAITPLGGVCFLAAWAVLAISLAKGPANLPDSAE
ncbi:MAG: DUF423 domain-containing protein [Fimbriimonadaceae bacterium]|nr:DUF423 domain-containing protein [Fimbriimonadaceae bacterium]